MDVTVSAEVVAFDESPKASFAQASVQAVMGVAEPVTLAEAKAHLRVVISDDDAYISGLITAARMALEHRINRALVWQTVTHTAHSFTPGMALPVVPYAGDLVVSYIDAEGAAVTLDPTTYVLSHTTPPRLYPARGQWFPMLTPWPGTVQITYSAGYPDPASVPAPLKQWILLAVGTMYEHRASVVAGVSVVEMPQDFMYWLWHPYKVYA